MEEEVQIQVLEDLTAVIREAVLEEETQVLDQDQEEADQIVATLVILEEVPIQEDLEIQVTLEEVPIQVQEDRDLHQ